jgi:hypothetical protein
MPSLPTSTHAMRVMLSCCTSKGHLGPGIQSRPSCCTCNSSGTSIQAATQANTRSKHMRGFHRPNPAGRMPANAESSPHSTHTQNKRTAAHRCCAGVVTRAQRPACGQPANAAAVHAKKSAPTVLLVHNQQGTPSTNVECQFGQTARTDQYCSLVEPLLQLKREGHTTTCSKMPQYKNEVSSAQTPAVLVVGGSPAVAGHKHISQFNKKCSCAVHQLHAAGCSKQHSCWPCMKQPTPQLRHDIQ